MTRLLPFNEPNGVVLWKNEAVSCTCRKHAGDTVEIRIIVVGVVIHRQLFSNADSASRFAIDQMHTYNARTAVLH